MFNPSREQVRSFFCDAWRKHRAREVLSGAEAVAADLLHRLAHFLGHLLRRADELDGA